jgi:lanosterol synthase
MARTKLNPMGETEDTAKTGEKRSFDSSNTTQTTKRPKLQERTDYSRWRLLDERGRQTWHYLENDEDAAEWPQTTADKYFLGLPTVWKLYFTVTSLLTVLSGFTGSSKSSKSS